MSVFRNFWFFRGVGSWNTVYIGRWSESGGEIVPAVVSLWVIVVSMVSISEYVLCVGSYLVGVVIVVWRLFSVREL